MNTRLMTWGGITATVLACIGLGIYFGLAGLSEATDLAGIIGMFVAVAGLGVSVWGVIAARGAQPPGGQVVSGSRIGGGVTQIRTVAGNAQGQGGQSVTDSEVTGPVNQREDIGGDLDRDGSL
jgi:hypothetical protein